MQVRSEWSLSAPQQLTFEEPVTALAVRILGGTVNVVGTDSGPAALRLSELDGPPLSVELRDGTLTVGYEDLSWKNLLDRDPGRLARKRTATVTLTVPAATRVEVGTVTAEAVVSGIAGRTEIRSATGDATLVGLTGEVRAETVAGRLEAQGLRGDLRLDSVSGDITLVESASGTVKADTVTGAVVVDHSPAAAAERLDVALGSVAGEVAVRLPAGAGVEVRASTMGGAVSCAFDELAVGGRFGARKVTGTLGSGSGKLRVATVTGAIALLRRPDTADGPYDGPAGAPAGAPTGCPADAPTGSADVPAQGKVL
ncbi:DUF4097 family beta strand repeat-containing protein [Streptomyces albireticuli]|uniref:DUF4097 domain-containing protein n=1 Tax=Streptomyces albireticuli TaxID=1940 RepID=A0A2A2D3B2_9ACTN|nr:hypothetical protein [Streptomyces albireticuli]MCD9142422.1 hypothetical protein [Streptomyces albireticuli]MCD9163822.1 hypothetical protein [Streptomyces albireticuli]MCD9192550.1 hypothetical protein [Streptomyces albireticuli]PAU45820.1 hypothetical protein CK936_27385 [Streptomyces albireticuli]